MSINDSALRVFLCYANEDDQAVRDLSERLRADGIECWLEDESLIPGHNTDLEVRKAVRLADVVIVCCSEQAIATPGPFHKRMSLALDEAEHQPEGAIAVVPLKLDTCDTPERLRPLRAEEFIDGQGYERLLRALRVRAEQVGKTVRAATSAHIFISYKRHTELDEPLSHQLQQAFRQAGHRVFLDQGMQVGVEWAKEIQRQIDACDYMVVLLSQYSIQSEMVARETAYAYHYSQQHPQKARLLPVRVAYAGTLPYQLSLVLDKLQYAEWHSDADTNRLIRQLLDVIRGYRSLASVSDTVPVTTPSFADIPQPLYQADPRFVEALVEPGGALKVSSDFYIEREGDTRLQRVLSRANDVTVTIRGSRQTGKTSLLTRGIAQARTRGCTVVFIDLQAVEARHRESLDAFLYYIATMMCLRLRLDPAEVARAWQSTLGAQDKTTYFIEDYILPKVENPIVLALDEVDRLLRTPFHDDFFGLVRYWHNLRAQNDRWDELYILMAISTEPHLLIKDFTQSPFNVGERIVLRDLSTAQVAALSQRYRITLNEEEVSSLTDFLGGHPYLTSKALYTLVTEHLTLEQLIQVATTPQSPFGDHLRRYLWLLKDQPTLRDALRQIIAHGRCADEHIFYRLHRAGLICGEGYQSCHCRCKVYETYFNEKLS